MSNLILSNLILSMINVKFEELYLKKDFNFVDLLGNIQYDEGGRIIGGHQNKSVQKLVQKHFLISATDNTIEKKLFHIFSFHRHFIFIYCLILWAAIKPLFSVEINNRSLPSKLQIMIRFPTWAPHLMILSLSCVNSSYVPEKFN